MTSFTANEILINATLVSPDNWADTYEVVLNDELYVLECVRVSSVAKGLIEEIPDYLYRFKDTLFELNHVRVNPSLNNEYIINKLTQELAKVGVDVFETPNPNSMKMVYRPLGEITETVRFHFNESGKCTFLCPSFRPRAIASNFEQINNNIK